MQPPKRPNSDRSPEELESRLRALPPPPVPSDLEARLLAAIPPESSCENPGWTRPPRSRRPAVWLRAGLALAASCLVAVLIWPDSGEKITDPRLPTSLDESQSAHLVAPQRLGESPNITPWLEVHQGLDGGDMPSFAWPVQGNSRFTASISIPPDLLD